MARNSKDGSLYRARKVDSIAKKYLFLSQEVAFMRLCSGNSDDDRKRRMFVKVVDQTFEELGVFYRKFILKEFFTVPSEAATWWTALYPKSTYYRYRNEAILMFLKLFYEKYKNCYGFDFHDLAF